AAQMPPSDQVKPPPHHQPTAGRRLRWLALMAVVVAGMHLVPAPAWAGAEGEPPKEEEKVTVLKGFAHLSKESATCVSCHKEKSTGLYQQWGNSKHFRANVGCYECHKADPKDADAIKHKDFVISTIVSPKDCAQCHKREVEEFDRSHHATAAQILGSLDNVLAEVVEGAPILHGASPVVVSGCASCHGSAVKVNSDGSLNSSTWPNSGIGRLNPDGSKGSCSACHMRHSFDVAQARHPNTCGRCHLGPDHPQKEVYEESQHGITFAANQEKMNLGNPKWWPGEDYATGPTCSTCHISATRDLPVTHDVGDRISWDLRSPVSQHIDDRDRKKGIQDSRSWIDRRKDMKTVCNACHGREFANNFYEQLDAFVELYNEKFAKPGARLMKAMVDNGILTKTQFDEKLEWTWFYLWHHEGRRARHGAAMNGPDYAHWHGMFEVAERFYMHMVPEMREMLEKAGHNGNKEGAAKVGAMLDEVLHSDYHKWFLGLRETQAQHAPAAAPVPGSAPMPAVASAPAAGHVK
ncbi:MAG: cytochrome c3 family protein, partial [Rhodospirillales bacterium]|nr:cytochrome c3 family protein [Rhodospirillales bacterium]